jgi:hypothetical protein
MGSDNPIKKTIKKPSMKKKKDKTNEVKLDLTLYFSKYLLIHYHIHLTGVIQLQWLVPMSFLLNFPF